MECGGSGGFFASCCWLAYYVFRRKRIRKEEELKLAQSYIDGLERERTRLAKDLHDGVCNDLLGIGMNMQYMQPTDESKREIWLCWSRCAAMYAVFLTN